MCGICGIVDYAGQRADFERRLPGMVETLRHRGPKETVAQGALLLETAKGGISRSPGGLLGSRDRRPRRT